MHAKNVHPITNGYGYGNPICDDPPYPVRKRVIARTPLNEALVFWIRLVRHHKPHTSRREHFGNNFAPWTSAKTWS